MIEHSAGGQNSSKSSLFDNLKLQNEKDLNELDFANTKIKDLESQIASYEDWKDITKNNHARLSSFPDIEKEVEFLRGKNKSLHELIGDKLLLEEQVYGLKTQLKIEDPEDTLSKSVKIEAEAPGEIFNENINNKNYNEKESEENELLGISVDTNNHEEMFIQGLQLEEKQELITERKSWQRQINIIHNYYYMLRFEHQVCSEELVKEKDDIDNWHHEAEVKRLKKVKKLTEAEQSTARPWETRRLKGELIDLKVSELEQEVDFGKFKSKLQEEVIATLKKEIDKQHKFSTVKIQDAETHQQVVRKREQAAQQKLVRMQRELIDLKHNSEDTIQKLKNAKDEIETEVRQMKNDMTNELEEYRLYTDKLSMELQLLNLNELDFANSKIKDLESQIASYEDWKDTTKNNQARLSSFPDIEKEVEFLRDKNKNLHELIGDKLLLEEQVYGLKTQLKIEDPEDTLSKSIKIEAETPEEIFNENINNKNYNEKESEENELLGISVDTNNHEETMSQSILRFNIQPEVPAACANMTAEFLNCPILHIYIDIVAHMLAQ
ncbi:mitotic spindle assembly checkpoint protein MAD1-like [Teleopsis dalmanni]|uniref:mitotic spindle assembly checkpoint protein MAD1-like n=1 Tax=Teleopsis dalmanni TaxID=139649 RepID=UPI0018CE2955|nr:mitotic spindle assembly checkpoint protein MAD1-like [Teleopsis dalmanni]